MEASSLGRLPPELRNRIYESLLPAAAEITINVRRRAPQSPRGADHKHIRALAQTCKGICRESTGLYYARNSFAAIFLPFYLGHGSIAMSPPHPRQRAVAEFHEWLNAIGQDAVRCMQGLKVILYGNLDFLETSSIKGIKPATAWLVDAIKEMQAVLVNVRISFELSLPFRVDITGNRFRTITVQVGAAQSAIAEVDWYITETKQSRYLNNQQRRTDEQSSPAELAFDAAKDDMIGERVKYFLSEIAA